MAEIQQNSAPPRGKIRSKKFSTRIDMTPMVDLAFLLLTFFILTAELRKPFLIEIQMPDQTEHMPINGKRVLTIIADANDRIYWYTGVDPVAHVTDFSNKGIRALIGEKKRSIPKLIVIIKSTDKARYNNLVDLVDEMIINEVLRYSIADVTKDDLELIGKEKLAVIGQP